MILAVTTYNRLEYLKECISSFLETRNRNYNWTLIVADDGSEDGTREYLEKLKESIGIPFYILRNDRKYCVGQTNSIFALCKELSYDLAFKVDDDVIFKDKGWDDLYNKAVIGSGYEHLCYLDIAHFLWNRKREDKNYKLPDPVYDDSGLLKSYCQVYKGMGALFTFTPHLIARVGAADERNFPIRGQWHIDYSMRCCRLGFNDSDYFFDADGSNELVTLQNNIAKDYRCSLPWDEEYKRTKEIEEINRRYRVIDDAERGYLALAEASSDEKPIKLNDFIDKVYILNLERRPDRWRKAQDRANAISLTVNKFPAVDGSASPWKDQWEAYAATPLAVVAPKERIKSSYEYYLGARTSACRVAYIEQKNKKKAIQTPGAWGYLQSMIEVLEDALEAGYKRILVLDDDFVPISDFERYFDSVIRQLPENWKIFQLGALQYHWEDEWITWQSRNIYKCNGSSVASHAVIYTESVFEELLAYCREANMPFDEGPLHYVKHRHKDLAFTAFPNLMIQDVAESEICSSRRQQREGVREDNVYRWKLSDYQFDQESYPGNDYLNGNVLHVRESYSEFSESFIYDLCINMDRNLNTISHVLCFRGLNEEERPFENVHLVPAKNYRYPSDAELKQAANIVAAVKPTLIICHFGVEYIKVDKILRILGVRIPVVIMLYGYDVYRETNQPEYLALLKRAALEDDVVFACITNYVRDIAARKIGIDPGDIALVNTIARDRFVGIAARARFQEEMSYRLLTVGRMVDWKGHDYLVRALSIVKEKIKEDIKLTIVAANRACQTQLESLIKKNNVESSVEIVGPVTYSELLRLYARSDIYIQPSYVKEDDGMTESFGVAALEAVYAGLPTIVTDAGGLPELSNYPVSQIRVVAQKSAESIASAILEIINQHHGPYRGVDMYDKLYVYSVNRQMSALNSAVRKLGSGELNWAAGIVKEN